MHLVRIEDDLTVLRFGGIMECVDLYLSDAARDALIVLLTPPKAELDGEVAA